jgi:hypothetical protein
VQLLLQQALLQLLANLMHSWLLQMHLIHQLPEEPTRTLLLQQQLLPRSLAGAVQASLILLVPLVLLLLLLLLPYQAALLQAVQVVQLQKR